MKRILVIDESEVVRETLALILGREFLVSKRALGAQGFSFAEAQPEVDLVILGVSPRYGFEPTNLVRFAAQLPFAVLLLVDSKATARAIQPESQVACLTKPFNPYDLHEKVAQLLARRPAFSKPVKAARDLRDVTCYLEYPYLSRSAASLVHRFAVARLPLLVTGEIGCGQDRVALGLCQLQPRAAFRVLINAAEASADYLAQKSLQLSWQEGLKTAPTTLVIHDLDKSSMPAQSALLNFLQEVEDKFDGVRYLATASSDLLERVYRGEFLEALYYKLATLTLKLPPLRERKEDIPVLAGWFARSYARLLGLSEPALSTQANSRLSNYLWFGNASELEGVIARTLALRRSSKIDAADLVFDFGENVIPSEQAPTPTELVSGQPAAEIMSEFYAAPAPPQSSNGSARSIDLNLLIHELAHEFKNPMVTIKTFAQLLGDRYEDENFRTRFQEVVGSDIERMDELLEVMIEFADFNPPRPERISLDEKLRTIVAELAGECAKRQARFDWKENGTAHVIRADESHLMYILKNVLLSTLSQTKIGSDIQIEIAPQGALTISYLREGSPVASIGRYFEDLSSRPAENILPLRVILAKHLLEKNGGCFDTKPSDGDREILRMEFPIAEHGQEN